MPANVSGLAAEIRNAVESETFDLGGQTTTTIEKTIRDAFTEPIPLPSNNEMIRLTFITGAGKLGRQKYDVDAAKVLTSTLRELGYIDDRGASAILECAGSYKLQHDTGKNLKTVVVFPKVSSTTTTTTSADQNSIGGIVSGLTINEKKQQQQGSVLGEEMPSPSIMHLLLDENNPEHKIGYSSMNMFKRMIDSRCPSWIQKRGCTMALEQIKVLIEDLDGKLLKGQPLEDVEQHVYDSITASSIDEKYTYVRDLMHKQVDECRITDEEHRILLEQVTKRIETLSNDIQSAKEKKQSKRIDNLQTAMGKAGERKEKLQTQIKPSMSSTQHPLRNESEISKLRKELTPLLAMEDASRGRLLTLKESQAMTRKNEIEMEIERLEELSRGWFESDESFNARVLASRNAWQSKGGKKKPASYAAASGAGASAATSAGGGGTQRQPTAMKWATPATTKKGGGGGGGNAWKNGTTKPKPKGGNLFAAMMDDSDSD